MDINTTNNEAQMLQIKRELICKLERFIAASNELRAQVDQIGVILEEEHRLPLAA